MLVGHYGPSYLGKGLSRTLPIWALFLAVQLLDILWSIFVLLGIEKVRIVPGITASNALDLYFMPYTHSLVAGLAWSLAAGSVWWLFDRVEDRRKNSVIIGAAVFSHWILYLVVHRPDLALYDDTMKMGLGLWNHRVLSLVAEAVVLLSGLVVFLRSPASRPGRRWNRWGTAVFVSLLLLLQAGRAVSRTVPSSDRAAAASALAAYLVFPAIAALFDRRT